MDNNLFPNEESSAHDVPFPSSGAEGHFAPLKGGLLGVR